MALKSGDRVKIVRREVTAEDRKENLYYAHLADLAGEIQAVYDDRVVIKVDPVAVVDPMATVYVNAKNRLHRKFADNATEEIKSKLSEEELAFPINAVVLVRASDVIKT